MWCFSARLNLICAYLTYVSWSYEYIRPIVWILVRVLICSEETWECERLFQWTICPLSVGNKCVLRLKPWHLQRLLIMFMTWLTSLLFCNNHTGSNIMNLFHWVILTQMEVVCQIKRASISNIYNSQALMRMSVE